MLRVCVLCGVCDVTSTYRILCEEEEEDTTQIMVLYDIIDYWIEAQC